MNFDEAYANHSFEQLNNAFTDIMNSNVSDADSGNRLLAITAAKSKFSSATPLTANERAAASKSAGDAKHAEELAGFKQKITEAEATGDTVSANRLKLELEDSVKAANDVKLKTTAANTRNKAQWDAQETLDAEIATHNMAMQEMREGSTEAAEATRQLNEMTGKRARMNQQHGASSQLPFTQEELAAAAPSAA